MTNEVTKGANEAKTRRYVVSDGTAIQKGYWLQLTAGMLAASYAVGGGQPSAGIASMDKEANDGSTFITTWVNGDFNCFCSGVITAGDPIIMASSGYASNAVQCLGAITASGAGIVGYALQDAANGETKLMHIDL